MAAKEKQKLTKKEFEDSFCRKSGIGKELLRVFSVNPCDCGRDGCKGWMMVPKYEGSWDDYFKALSKVLSIKEAR